MLREVGESPSLVEMCSTWMRAAARRAISTRRVVAFIAVSGERQTGWERASPSTRSARRSRSILLVLGMEGGAPARALQDLEDAVVVLGRAASRWRSP